jgi:hypothetical protein
VLAELARAGSFSTLPFVEIPTLCMDQGHQLAFYRDASTMRARQPLSRACGNGRVALRFGLLTRGERLRAGERPNGSCG